MVTRSGEQAARFACMLEAAGADVFVLPMIAVEDPPSWDTADQALHNLETFDMIIFTSANAVDQWMKRSQALARPAVLASHHIGAVGAATAERLALNGVTVNLIPRQYSAEGLLESLEENLEGRRILLPRGDLARDELPRGLRDRGAEVTEVIIYSTRIAELVDSTWAERILRGEFDVITFASPSAVHYFAEWLGPAQLPAACAHFHAASIGPTTSATLRDHRIEVTVEADPSTLEGLTASLIRRYSSH